MSQGCVPVIHYANAVVKRLERDGLLKGGARTCMTAGWGNGRFHFYFNPS